MIKLHDCNLTLEPELQQEMILMLEQLKQDVQDGFIVGFQVACVRADGLGHELHGGIVNYILSEIHAQFILLTRDFSPLFQLTRRNSGGHA